MRLMTPEAWLHKYFSEESRPPHVTLRRWLREGKIPGRKIGGAWYIDEHAWLANGDELLLRILNAG